MSDDFPPSSSPDPFQGGPSGDPPQEPPAPEYIAPSWENFRSIGLLSAWFRTIGEVLARPDQTFYYMKRDGGMGAPLGFFALTVWTTHIIGFFLSLPVYFLFKRTGADPFHNLPPQLAATMEKSLTLSSQFESAFLTAPALWLLWLFVLSGVVHLLLMILGGARRPYLATFRAAAYAGGACSAVGMLPFCGCESVLMIVAVIVIASIALTRVHETDTWRAVLATTLPLAIFLMCCCCFGGAVFYGLVNSPEFLRGFEEAQRKY